MRIHTNGFRGALPSPGYGFGHGWEPISDALVEQKALGRIAPTVTFKKLEAHRSHSHRIAYEVQLTAAEPGQGRRAGNSGAYGGMNPRIDGYAATFDEWGWLLAALYHLDPTMMVGTGVNAVYINDLEFHQKTADTYNPEALLRSMHYGGVDPFPIVTGKASKTKAGYVIGRRGADRADWNGYRASWGHAERPRTIAEVIAFAWPNGAPDEIATRYAAYLTTPETQEAHQ